MVDRRRRAALQPSFCRPGHAAGLRAVGVVGLAAAGDHVRRGRLPTLHEKVAALLHSLARDHPFVDGNKRTAWAAAAVFYQINGHVIGAEVDDGLIVGLVVDVAEGLMDVPAIAAALKEWAQPYPTPAEWIDDDDPTDSGRGRHHRD